MHGTMRPVEVRVVKHDHHEDAEKEIRQSILFNFVIRLRVLHQRREEHDISDDRKNESSDYGIGDLANVIAAQRKFRLYSFKSPRVFFENVENKKRDSSKNQVSQKNNEQ